MSSAAVGVDAMAVEQAWLGMNVLAVDVMIALAGLSLMLGDVVLPHGSKKILGWTALAQLVLCLVATFFLPLHGAALSGAYVGDDLAIFFKRLFLFAGILGVLGGLARVAADAERRQGEYYQLLLFSVLGMTLLAGARDLILLLVAFELMSMPLYAMAAYGRTGPQPHRKGPLPVMFLPASEKWLRPAEAGIKLFIVGAVSSAVAAYGMSLVYGAAGSTRFVDIALVNHGPLLALGMTLMLAGFGFKIGAAPFHMWVPDTYEGASTPFVAFLSVAPKAAGLAALVQLLLGPFAAHHSSVAPMLLGLAVVSVAVGNLMAVPQQNIKRLLGFSGVGQIGFALMALLACSPDNAVLGNAALANGHGLAPLLFFLGAYMVANMGIFFVVEAIAASRTPAGELVSERDDDDAMATFAGLADRSPWLAMCALLFLLSLGGIPFAVGFWAKVYVLMAVWKAGYAWLVLVAAVVSAAGLFYYLQVARSMYMASADDTSKVRVTPALVVAIVVCAALTAGVGLYPAPAFDAARAAAASFVGG